MGFKMVIIVVADDIKHHSFESLANIFLIADLTQYWRHINPPNPYASGFLEGISGNQFGTTSLCAKLEQEVVFLRHQGICVDRHGNVRVST